jgi:nucleotide-binding universal stress UspA family protein
MAGSIVVGYDGGEGAERALSEAVTLARELGAKLIAVFGYEPRLAEREVKDYRDALQELGEGHTRSAVETAKSAGVEAVAEVIDRRAAEALMHAASEHDARMIVVGSHGERPLAAALLGSTPHRLVHLSDRPVLVVRA